MNQQIITTAYTQNYTKVFYFLKKKCISEMEAQDLTQDCFIKYFQNVDKVEPGKESSFLFKIAQNLFIDQKRKEKVRLKYVNSCSQKDEYINPEYKLIYKEFNAEVQSKINSMPINCREVFIMNKIEQKTYNEIAEIIGLSVKSVEKRMTQALRIFRELKKCS
jgi:RNA polymerase sigma-70 factor (ECF subfamily)